MPSLSTQPALEVRLRNLAGCAFVALAATVAPAAAQSPPSGVVYVEGNVADAPGNQVFGFKRDDAGALTPLNGSPFPAGGAGISPSFDLGPYDSDQEIISNPEHTLVFATNGGSDSIAVFRVQADGGLAPVEGSPFPSGGSNPVGLSLTGDKLVVVNQDNDPGHPGVFLPSYTTLQVLPGGKLRPIRGASVTLDRGSNPSQALSPRRHPSLVFGCEFFGGVLRSFRMDDRGRLNQVDVQALPPDEFAGSAAPPFPLGLWAHPKRPLLYVGFVTINRIGVYRYDAGGRLEFIRSVPDSGTGVCWFRTNRAGTRLYASNTTDPSISVYDLSRDPSAPIEIQKVSLRGMSNVYQITLDPAGEFFYAVTQRNSADLPASANALHVLKIGADGKLTEVATSPTILPVPASTRPQGVLAF